MKLGINTVTTRLDTDKSDTFIPDEIVESSDSVTSTSDTCNDGIWQFTLFLDKLGFDLSTDDSLEITDDGRERVGTDS